MTTRVHTWLVILATGCAVTGGVSPVAGAGVSKSAAPKPEGRIEIKFDPPSRRAPQVRDTVTALLLSDSPRIDGDLSEAAWKEASKILLRHDTATGKQAGVKTTAYVGHRNDVLYVGALCETAGSSHRRPMFDGRTRDRPVWLDDSLELLFDVNHDHMTFDAIVVNCAGAVADFRYSYERDLNWNAGVSAAAQVGKGSWSVEIAVSKKSFEDPGNAIWGFNVARRRAGMRGALSWNPVLGKVRDAGRMGHLSFERFPCYIRSASFGNLRKGENVARVEVVNQSGFALQMHGALAIGYGRRKPKKTRYKLALRPQRTELLGCPFNVCWPGECDVAFGIVDPETHKLRCAFTRRRVTAVEPLRLSAVKSVPSAVVLRVRLGLTLRELKGVTLLAALRRKAGASTLARARTDDITSRCATVKVLPRGLSAGSYEVRVTLADGRRVIASEKQAFRLSRTAKGE